MTMSVRDLIPWAREESRVPSLFRDSERDPFLSLHREVNRLFDDVFRGFDSGLPSVGRASAFGGNWPSVEISDNDKEIKVTAEVPGMEERDIEVLLDDGVLTLRGEKRSETDDKARINELAYNVVSVVTELKRNAIDTAAAKLEGYHLHRAAERAKNYADGDR